MQIENAYNVIEALRRGVYDARQACNPEYPTLTKVIGIRTAEMLIEGYERNLQRIRELEAQVKFLTTAKTVLAEPQQEVKP